MLILIIGAAILLAIDLVTKAIFYTHSGFTVIPGIFSFEPVSTPNRGAAWGIFQGHIVPLIIFTLIFLAAGIIFYWKFKQGRSNIFYNFGCAFFLGGALGNLYDRIFLDGVRDFLQFDFISFPVFNFADVFLNIGIAMIIIYVIFIYKGKESANHS